MLASVLRSKRAVEVNIAIVRTFIRLRQGLASNEELARKVAQHDQEIGILFEHIQHLLEPPTASQEHQIGFKVSDKEEPRGACGWAFETGSISSVQPGFCTRRS